MSRWSRLQSLPRRRFLQAGAALAAGLLPGIPGSVCGGQGDDRYAGLRSDEYLGPVDVVAHVEDSEVFTEGPAVDREGTVFFTNVPASKILRWDPGTRQLSLFRENAHETNGLYFAPDGSLLACEGNPARITRTDMRTGRVETVADQYGGKPFAKPNDLCIDGHGRIYFTSRSAPVDPPGENAKAVYRIDPDGTVTQLLRWPQIHMPNGIVTSPDNKQLYVIEAHPDADHHRDIRVFDLDSQGNLSKERVLIDFYPGRSGDGMCIDAEGNLYVAAGLHRTRKTSETLDTRPGIHVISPRGQLVAFRQTPEDTVTNCAFGGTDLKTLYVTCGTRLLAIRTQRPGKPAYRPNG
jgi:gluconolactonase